jgi:hypothetical protein
MGAWKEARCFSLGIDQIIEFTGTYLTFDLRGNAGVSGAIR